MEAQETIEGLYQLWDRILKPSAAPAGLFLPFKIIAT